MKKTEQKQTLLKVITREVKENKRTVSMSKEVWELIKVILEKLEITPNV